MPILFTAGGVLRGALVALALPVVFAIVLAASGALATCATLLTAPTNGTLRACSSATTGLLRAVDDGAERLDGVLHIVQDLRP